MFQVTSENFEAEVLKSNIPVLVEFFAVWCGPCKAMEPVLASCAAEYNGQIKVGKLDIEEHGDIAMKYGIMNVPTIVVFKSGKAVKRLTGLRKEKELRAAIDAVLS